MNPFLVDGYKNKDEYMLRIIFEKAFIIRGYDKDLFRKDIYGNIISFNHYGNYDNEYYGWEIDHIIPKSKEGSNMLENLQPLRCSTNRSLGNNECKLFIKTYELRKYFK